MVAYSEGTEVKYPWFSTQLWVAYPVKASLPKKYKLDKSVDGKPAFWVKPGVFHGQPAVQIKARIDGESVEKEKKI